MTAANLFAGPAAAYLLADQGGYADDGTLLAIFSKVSASAELKLALSTSGRSYTGSHDMISAWLATQTSQDEVLQSLPGLADEILAECEYNEPDSAIPPFVQFFVALWSDRRNQPELYVCGTPGCMLAPPYRPGTVVGVQRVYSPRVDPRFYHDGSDDPEAAALRLINEQRTTPDERGIYRVGGGAELVTVRADGIERRTIISWPDRIGEKIEPAAAGD